MKSVKVLWLALAAVAVLVTGFGLATSNADQHGGEVCVPIEPIRLEPPAGVEAKKSPVDFPHARHFDFHCNKCHHDWQEKAEVKTCMTAGCHDLAEAPKKEDGKPDRKLAIRYYKTAFHKSCIRCHQQMARANKKAEMSVTKAEVELKPTGPTGCVECHPKQ